MSEPKMNQQPLPGLPARADDGHKGTFGRALIVAGSRGMSGAAALAGLAALRAGTGLVTIGTPSSIQPVVASFDPSYLTLALADDRDGRLSLECAPELISHFSSQDAGAIGPGLSQSADLDELVHLLYRTVEQPLVIDADALNALAHRRGASHHAAVAGPRILTPHPGEFARLTGDSIDDVQANRESKARQFAGDNGVIVVLKGARTIVTDGDRVFVNSTGNSGLATGGTGDVLTGVMTGLLCQKMKPFEAAQLAVHLHGLAGELASQEFSEFGLIASDLPRMVARVIHGYGPR